jgi:hypothetical protein
MSSRSYIEEEVNTEVNLSSSSYQRFLELIDHLMRSMGLASIALPTFILEPRSLLERITDMFGHPDTILKAAHLTNPMERLLAVIRFHLSSWHLKPKGVKRPYQPILGEFFRCQWKYRDHSQAFYIAEQVPSSFDASSTISSYYYACPEHDVVVTGNLEPRSKCLGNTIITFLQGHTYLYFTNQENEMYDMTLPNVYLRGVIFGTMFTELGDTITIVCKKTDLACTLKFKTKVRRSVMI